MNDSLMEIIAQALQNGENEKVAELTAAALNDGVAAKYILDNALIAGMKVIGDKFKAHDVFLPDVLLAARAMNAGLELLKPHFLQGAMPVRGKIVIGTVRGDMHDIGKNLVAVMLRGAGYTVVDLGNDVAPDRFVDTAESEGADIIGLSALLTTTMPVMSQVAQLLTSRGLRDKIGLIVGGAPVTADFAGKIGADAYGFDAVKAVEIVDDLMARHND